MRNWPVQNAESPAVTVRCITYNQENYIRKALDSFLEQETEFPFEIVVHDDASTDRTADIIREYEAAYPHIVKPIYEEENLYSKHDGSLGRVISAHCHGTYIALCEGDDYWCDKSKLQKQYDYMESHPECAMCCHNTRIHDIDNVQSDRLFHDWDTVHLLTDDDVFWSWNVHTSSRFYRNSAEYINAIRQFSYPLGDAILKLVAYAFGTIASLPEVMSVYNLNVPTSVTKSQFNSGIEKWSQIQQAQIDFLNEYDSWSKGRYHKVIRERIAILTFDIELLENRPDPVILKEASTILKSSEGFSKRNARNGAAKRLLWTWKYLGSSFGSFWYHSLLLYKKLKN